MNSATESPKEKRLNTIIKIQQIIIPIISVVLAFSTFVLSLSKFQSDKQLTVKQSEIDNLKSIITQQNYTIIQMDSLITKHQNWIDTMKTYKFLTLE